MVAGAGERTIKVVLWFETWCNWRYRSCKVCGAVVSQDPASAIIPTAKGYRTGGEVPR